MFTLFLTLEGPDHRASLEPDELMAMVQAIRNIEKAMGDGIKRPSPSEIKNKTIVRKSICLKLDLPAVKAFSKYQFSHSSMVLGWHSRMSAITVPTLFGLESWQV